jgi:twitching motility protein PilT
LPAAEPEGAAWLDRLLGGSRARFATDLLLVAGSPPAVRVHGRLETLEDRPLSEGATAMLCAALVPPERREHLGRRGSVDFALRVPGRGRFRCNVHRERDRWAAAVRVFPTEPPELETLHLPSEISRFADLQYGLVLVTGPTGCGKTTTLAALVRRILRTRAVHLVTIEDPVEYEHAHAGNVVEHVEIDRDTTSFANALRSALRQDPDVLLIGEMRDPQSIGIAITAAETGHLVLSTLHTGDGPQTIHRILDSYPPGQTEVVRSQLAASLAGIVSQQLLPRRDGQGRVPAVEILRVTPGMRNLIRKGQIERLRSQMSLEKGAGMVDLDESLARLVDEGLVEAGEARARSRAPEEFDRRLSSGHGGVRG